MGANILVKGTGKGTVSDVNGNFTLDADGNKEIAVNYIGYEPITLPADTGKEMLIAMNESKEALNEVVVVGYGQDIINNYYNHGKAENADYDVLEMQGLKYSECELFMNGNDLIIKVKGTSDSVTIKNCFESEYYRIDNIKFTDKIMSYDNIVEFFKTTGTTISGTSGDDRITSNILSWAKATIGGREGDDMKNDVDQKMDLIEYDLRSYRRECEE